MRMNIHEYNTIQTPYSLPYVGRGCQHAVLRIQNGGEMGEICGTFTDVDLSKQAVVSVSDKEKIQ